MNGTKQNQATQTWLVERWQEHLEQVVRSMTGETPVFTSAPATGVELGPEPLLFEQKLADSAEPLVWIGVPLATWRVLGARVLQAAGIETETDEERRGTCLKILQQAMSGLAQTIAAKLGREVPVPPSGEPLSFPDNLAAPLVSITLGGNKLPPLRIAFAPTLLAWFEERAMMPMPPLDGTISEMAGLPGSKTFELLLDVALPVSISFGKTELAVKDVLKLTTGSIVELNRAVSEPVDIIVNNCTIARGEVVVVNGNYGVRIHCIVSRQERLRTGSSADAASRLLRA